MEFQEILYDVDGPVATITMHRPDRMNAFTIRMQREMVEAFELTDADDAVRAVIVTGSGRGFCAGADLGTGGGSFDADATGVKATSHTYPRDFGGLLTLRIFESKKPVIAAINGPAVGIGITMTLPMDVRLVADNAKIGFVFAGRGIVPEAASSWFLPRVVGIGQASRVEHDGPSVQGRRGARRWAGSQRASARRAAAGSPCARHRDRDQRCADLGGPHPSDDVAHARGRPSDGGPQDRLAGVYSTGRSPDAFEGVTAFLEKRHPDWGMKPSTDMPEWYPWWTEPTYE